METRKIKLGNLKSLTKTGHAIIMVNDPNIRIKLRWPVYDSQGNKVGIITDLIGNVESPYAVVKLSGSGEGLSEGESLFVVIPSKKRGAKKRGRDHRHKGRRSNRRGRPFRRARTYNHSSKRRGGKKERKTK